MKRVVTLFTEHRNSIHYYLRHTLENFTATSIEAKDLQRFFDTEKAAEIIYAISRDFIQITPDYGRYYCDNNRIGKNKIFYFQGLLFDIEPIYITNPYLHGITGMPCVTAIKQEIDHFIVVDFDMLKLLEELRLIEYNSQFDKVNKVVMGSGSILLGLVSIFLILYGGYIFARVVLLSFTSDMILHEVFTSVISITIGLAIYDLSKTMIENEVLFKSLNSSNEVQSKILSKFLTSIIIALSIESLMAVFKIVLDDYSKIINAFYLIVGVTLLLVGTGFYNYFSRPQRKSDNRSS
ncbi:MAG: hypothetical protein PHV62_08390 [Sulfuricurvum sp.]|nr:hypothetical protein [Sulfuricurvum sp.]